MQLQGDSVIIGGWFIRRMVTPNFVRVFRYEGVNGETPEQLAQMLEEDKLLASENIYDRYGRKLRDYQGQPI